MEGQFKASSQNGTLHYHSRLEYSGYLRQFPDTEFIVTLSPTSSYTEKEQMYAYFHGPILEACVLALTNDGFTGIDKVVAEEYLKDNLLRNVIYNKNDDRTLNYPMSKKAIDKTRLLKFIVDCLFLLEERHNTIVMDGSEYKEWQATGRRIRAVGGRK